MADTESASKANGYNWRYSYTSVSQNESTDAFRGCEVSVQKSKHQHATIQFPPSQTTGHIEMEIGNSKSSIIQETVKYWPQYLSVISATLALFVSGLHFGWVAPALPILLGDDSPYPVTSSQSAWVASFIQVGSILGPTVGSLLCDTVGRKIAIILTAIPMMIGFIIIIFAESVQTLYAARIIGGIGVGASFAILPLYIGEISTPKVRGTLSFFISIQLSLGMILQYCTIPFIGIVANAILCSVLAFLQVVASFFVPESPYYYLLKGQDENAKKVLKTLRNTEDIDTEFEHLKIAIAKEKEERVNILDVVTKRSNILGLMITCGLAATQMISGLPAILSYSQVIFDAAHSNLSTNASGILLQCINLIITLISTVLIDSWGRRPLLLISAYSSVVPLFTIGLYFYLQAIDYVNIDSISLLPLISLIVFSCTFYCGVNPMPFVYGSEIFPPTVRATAATIQSTFGSIVGVFVTKMYQITTDAYGIYVGFWGFAICCFTCAVIFTIFIPETKGKSLEEIQTILKSKSGSKKEEIIEQDEEKKY